MYGSKGRITDIWLIYADDQLRAETGHKELTSLTRKNRLVTSRKVYLLKPFFDPYSAIKDDKGAILSQIFKYGVQNLYCESNPAQPLQGCTKKPQIKHMPAIIEDAEFAQLLRTIDNADNLMASVKLCLNVAPFVLLTSS